ncbi:MAG: glucose-6-phosphate dehydrogenase, partial [Spirochaetaceae bacterium]|nr:glucose-6-phosphate dehydrogenase [Spirochaetaceae bacterium]
LVSRSGGASREDTLSDLDPEAGFCDLGVGAPEPKSATIVVFGATGDLTRRKIAPALYNLERSGSLPSGTRMIGFARSELDDGSFRALLREGCASQLRGGSLDEAAWSSLAARIRYLRGDIDDGAAYAALAAMIREPGAPPNALFYMAVAPDRFAMAARMLAAAGLGSAGAASVADAHGAAGPGFRRLVVEKPFGYDLASARALNAALQATFREEDIFRIDHYLGKETVQNLLYFRFANAIFEPLWNRNHIERVEIDVLETAGIGSRGGYYDKAGAARDMLQNHMVQLLCLVAMEPPPSLDPEAIRSEKAKVLASIRDYRPLELRERSVRAQYQAGRSPDGAPIPDYRHEAMVASDSTTETYVQLRLEVDTWRFEGVPFVLRTGKALDRQASEIRVLFRRPPATLFAGHCGDRLARNALVLRIQPDEGMWLSVNAKVPGAARIAPKDLRFAWQERGGDYLPEAYERLLADALAGDATLFIRSDEAEGAWRIVDALEEAWSGGAPLLRYPAGSAGPVAS